MSLISKIDTKKEAFKLVHDPVKLLSLLYLKYGDIEEEYYISFTNKLIYNTPCRFNAIFKECQLNISRDDYLKRFYKKRETIERLPMLSDYYKNYHLFFCKPVIRDFLLYDLLHSHEELKAEIFYKNNYKDDTSIKNLENNENENETSSLSSLDNITNNKTIFTKRNKNIIDNDLDEKMFTLTLNTESVRNKININENDYGLLSKRSLNDSFKIMVKNLVEYQFNKNKKNKENKEKKIKDAKNKKNYLFKINNGYYTSNHLNNKRKKIISQNSYKHIYNHINIIKHSLNTISRKTFSYKNSHIKNRIRKPKNKSHSIKNIFYSTNPEKNIFSKNSYKFNDTSKKINIKSTEKEKTQINNLIISKINNVKNNKNNNNNRAINKNSNYNFNNKLFNMNNINTRLTNYKNFSKLSAMLNFNAKNNSNSISQKMFNTIQHKKISYSKNMNDFLTINNDQINTKTFNNNNKKKNNKTFDFNITNNINNKKVINDIGKKNRNKNIYSGSKFNLVKGNIHIINNMSKSIPKTNLKNIHKKNIINKISMNYSSNYHIYKNNAMKSNQHKSSLAKSTIPRFNIVYSKGEINISNNNKNNNKDNNKLFYLSNNNSIVNDNKNKNNDNIQKISNKNNVSYTNNNFNINFNNVFFCSQRITPGSNENINYNSENNNIKNNNININNKNMNITSNNSNNNTMNKVNNNVYIKNLKCIYNISRNKNNIKGSSLTQNQTGNKGKSSNKNSKEKNLYSLNNNYNIPANKIKYIIKEKDLNNNSKHNDKKSNLKSEAPKSKIINKLNKRENINIMNHKDDINLKKSNNINRNIYTNKNSIRGNSIKNLNIRNKNFNLTSKNNSKSKYKKKISNFV